MDFGVSESSSMVIKQEYLPRKYVHKEVRWQKSDRSSLCSEEGYISDCSAKHSKFKETKEDPPIPTIHECEVQEDENIGRRSRSRSLTRQETYTNDNGARRSRSKSNRRGRSEARCRSISRNDSSNSKSNNRCRSLSVQKFPSRGEDGSQSPSVVSSDCSSVKTLKSRNSSHHSTKSSQIPMPSNEHRRPSISRSQSQSIPPRPRSQASESFGRSRSLSRHDFVGPRGSSQGRSRSICSSRKGRDHREQSQDSDQDRMEKQRHHDSRALEPEPIVDTRAMEHQSVRGRAPDPISESCSVLTCYTGGSVAERRHHSIKRSCSKSRRTVETELYSSPSRHSTREDLSRQSSAPDCLYPVEANRRPKKNSHQPLRRSYNQANHLPEAESIRTMYTEDFSNADHLQYLELQRSSSRHDHHSYNPRILRQPSYSHSYYDESVSICPSITLDQLENGELADGMTAKPSHQSPTRRNSSHHKQNHHNAHHGRRAVESVAGSHSTHTSQTTHSAYTKHSVHSHHTSHSNHTSHSHKTSESPTKPSKKSKAFLAKSRSLSRKVVPISSMSNANTIPSTQPLHSVTPISKIPAKHSNGSLSTGTDRTVQSFEDDQEALAAQQNRDAQLEEQRGELFVDSAEMSLMLVQKFASFARKRPRVKNPFKNSKIKM